MPERVINELLVDTFNTILKVEQDSLRQYGEAADLTVTEVHTLEAVGTDDVSHSMSEIAARLAVTVATVTVAINRLSSKGFTARRVSDDDRRVVLVSLTDAGRQVVEAHRAYHRRMVDAATEGLTDEEIEMLARVLKKVKNYFDRPETSGELIEG